LALPLIAAKSMVQRPEASAADRRLEPEPPAWPLLEAAGWPVAAIAFILCGVAARLVGGESAADLTWSIGLAIAATPIAWRTLVDARHGRFATDIVATLAIVGALLLGEPLAGLVVVLMKRGGDALERYAEGKASAAVRALEAAAPRVAHLVKGTSVVDVAATAVEVGDLLLIRPGELIPCDGVIEDGVSDLDTSSLTGEPTFPAQGDAESWLGEAWRDLAEAGVAQVTLFENDREVYGPMSLSA
jgi:cation transport ATPase